MLSGIINNIQKLLKLLQQEKAVSYRVIQTSVYDPVLATIVSEFSLEEKTSTLAWVTVKSGFTTMRDAQDYHEKLLKYKETIKTKITYL